MGIDSESLLFAKLKGYEKDIPYLISRRQYITTEENRPMNFATP